MIRKDGHEITGIYRKGHIISAVYKGASLVWMAVRSCFGSGVWINNKPWLNNEKWKNNK